MLVEKELFIFTDESVITQCTLKMQFLEWPVGAKISMFTTWYKKWFWSQG